MKIQQINIDIFSNRTLQELTDCFFWFGQIKMLMLKDLKLESVTY